MWDGLECQRWVESNTLDLYKVRSAATEQTGSDAGSHPQACGAREAIRGCSHRDTRLLAFPAPSPPVLLDWGLRLSGRVFVQCLFTVELALQSKTPAMAWVWWFHCCCVSKPGRQGHRADQNVPESRDLWKREMLLFAGTWQLPYFSSTRIFRVNSELSKEV